MQSGPVRIATLALLLVGLAGCADDGVDDT